MFSFGKSLNPLVNILVASMFLLTGVVEHSAVTNQKKSPIEGVWKIAEVVPPASNPADKPTPITNPQPGLIIFTKGYYSGVAVTGVQPRPTVGPAKDPRNLTDAEKIARFEQWNQFIANAGTYEVNGSTLVMHALVAKNQERMTTAPNLTFEIKLEGSNTLWLIPPADRATDPRVKLSKVE